MVIALPGLALLAAMLVAFGLIYFGRAFVDALFGILNTVLKYSGAGIVFRGAGWVWRQLGGNPIDPISKAHQFISDKLGAAADAVGAGIAMSWHALETIVRDTGWAISQLAIAVDRIRDILTDREQLAKVITGTAAFAAAVKILASRLSDVIDKTTTITKWVARPVASPIGTAIHVVTRVDRASVTNLRAWTLRKVHALEAAIAHAGAQAIPYPGSALGELEGVVGRIWQRVRSLERGAVAAVGAGALTYALARLGANWIRCGNVSRLGKGACRMDPSQLEELLTGTLAVLSPLSLTVLAEELAAVVEDVADVVVYFAGGDTGAA